MNPNKQKAADTLTGAAQGLAALAASSKRPKLRLLALVLAALAALAALLLSGCAGSGSFTYGGVEYTLGAAPAGTKKPAHGCTAPGAKCPPPGAILGE